MPKKREGTEPTSVAERLIAVLDVFDCNRRSFSLTELSDRTGLPRATVHRLATALVAGRMLERDGTKFALGLHTFELGQRVPRQRLLREVAAPYMSDLREAIGLTINLCVLDGRDAVYVDILRGREVPPSLRAARPGGRLPAHATGVGKAMLAHAPIGVVDDYLAVPLKRLGPRTIGDPALLRAELEQIRIDGVGFDREESSEGLVCAACPVLGRNGTVVAGLSAAGWSHRIVLDHIASAVRTSSMAITRALGGVPAPLTRRDDVGELETAV